ncbi:M24 family metallopeptidase [Halorubrum laminariae]|uniref:M24 family metallopeptidase n=1 Tax=Halorubrum laminariae TaxID=1433523 RepID=A0ABD6BZH5_9EURY|nr:M24 family metallopeptidase [Halorubrum laminariae]
MSGGSDDAAPGESASASRPLRTDLAPIAEAVAAADADAFVAVGDRFDDDLRYLTRFSGPDRAYALVVVPSDDRSDADAAGRAVCCVPSLFRERADREFVSSARTQSENGASDGDGEFHDGVVRAVRTERTGGHAGERAAAVVRDLLGDDGNEDSDGNEDGDRTLLVPPSIPHDAAVYLERAGNALASTDAVADARARKTAAEIDRLRRVQRAAATGMARAETVLAESAVDADGTGEPILRWNGEPLATERLRREVNAALAVSGVSDAGDTAIGVGRSAADRHYRGDEPIRPGETVLIGVSPRGPDGYRGNLTRTFVVDGDGGWERRASVAVESAREVALAEIEPGVPAKTVHGETAAELAAYGFDPNADEGEPGFLHDAGHGVGMSRHEAPSLSRAGELRTGHVVAVDPGVYDSAIGGVRLGDLAVVTEDGYELLAEYPLGMVPATRE